MSARSNRGWVWFSLIGIALWVGSTVAVALIGDDPSDGRPVLLTFAGGGAIFFGLIFGAAWVQTRPRRDPELDALLAELAIEPDLGGNAAHQINGMQRVGRLYILLGALVTAMGLAAIVQAALEVGTPETTWKAMVGVVVIWALAVPFILRQANRTSASVLSPMLLELSDGVIAGERNGRRVRIELSAKGWVTRLYGAEAGDVRRCQARRSASRPEEATRRPGVTPPSRPTRRAR